MILVSGVQCSELSASMILTCICYGGGCDRVLIEFVVTLLEKNSPFYPPCLFGGKSRPQRQEDSGVDRRET